MPTTEREETCANCGKKYYEHIQPFLYCHIGTMLKWFPKSVADVIDSIGK